MDFNEYVQWGMAHFQEQKIGLAIESFEKALKLQPDNADVRQLLEMLKQQANMEAEAAKQRAESKGTAEDDKVIAEYSEALKRNPNDTSAKRALASAYYTRGLAFTSVGDHAKSIEDYNEAINYEPEHVLAFNKRGWANLEVGNYDQAIKDFEKVVHFKPNENQPKQNLASAYMKRGISYDKKSDYANAIPDFEMVLKLKPDDNTARELLEMAKAGMGKK
jgi:tetratricopeptide (TPR) repeat protein